ncbi:hypothetical protein FA95DRAFT_1470125, partial [Auriscalpium vulgare]
PGHRGPGERFWADNQKKIEAVGYTFRPRYHGDRKFSWTRWKLPRSWFEDWQRRRIPAPSIIDATRMTDGKQVILKEVPDIKPPDELEISKLFSSEQYRWHPKNHCIPLLETQRLEGVSSTFLVLPRMRPYDNPQFRTFGEFVAFATQIIEGLAFMHENHVAHRDCTGQNIVLDPSGMYPNSFHP